MYIIIFKDIYCYMLKMVALYTHIHLRVGVY